MIKRILIIGVLVILIVGILYRLIIMAYGLKVTSWWRAPWHNVEVGGMAFSLHQIGWAFDIIPVNQAIQSMISWLPGKIVVESDHIHFQIL